MRNLSFKGVKWDKKFICAYLLTVACAIICGIVLCIFIDNNNYFDVFTQDYVYYVFNFRNGSLIFTHLLAELIYLYLVFLICFFCKYKYFSLIVIFLRGLFFGIYTALLFAVSAIGGATVAIFVFIPTGVLSLVFCFIVAETCKVFKRKYTFAVPALLSVANCLVLVLLVNVVFRFIIIIA